MIFFFFIFYYYFVNHRIQFSSFHHFCWPSSVDAVFIWSFFSSLFYVSCESKMLFFRPNHHSSKRHSPEKYSGSWRRYTVVSHRRRLFDNVDLLPLLCFFSILAQRRQWWRRKSLRYWTHRRSVLKWVCEASSNVRFSWCIIFSLKSSQMMKNKENGKMK